MYGHEELFQDIGQINDSIHGDIGEVFSFSLNENPVGSSSFSGRPVQSPQPTPGSSHNNSFAMGDMRSINSAFGMEDPQMSTPPLKQTRTLRNPQKYGQQGAMQQNSRTRRASASDPDEMQVHHTQQYLSSHQMSQQMSPQMQQPMNPQQMSPMNPQQMSPQMPPQMQAQMAPQQQMAQMGHMGQPMGQQMTPQMQAQQISQQISQQQLNQMQMAQQMNQQMGQMGGQQMGGPQGMNGQHMGLQQMNQQQMTGPPMQGPMGNPQHTQQQMGPGTPQMGPNQQMSGPMGGQMGTPQQMGMGNPQMTQGMNGHHGMAMQQMTPQQMHGRAPQQRPHAMPMQMMNPEQQMGDQQGYSRSVPMHMAQSQMQMQDNGPQVSRLRPKKTSILISQDQQSYLQQSMVQNQNLQVKPHLVPMDGQPMVQNYSRPKNQLRISQKSLHAGQFVPGQSGHGASQEIPLHLPLQLPLGSQFQARPTRANPMKYSQIVYQQPAIVSHAPIMTQAGNFRQIMPTRGISQERLLPPDSVIFGDAQGGHPNPHYDSSDEVVTIEDFKNILNQINRTLRVLRGQGPPGAMEHLKNSCDQFRAFMIELQGSPQQQFYRKRVPVQQGQPQPPQPQPVGQPMYRHSIEEQKMSMDNQSPLGEDDSGSPESDFLEDDSFDDDLKSKRKLRNLKGKSKQSKKKRLKLETEPGNPSPQLTDFEVRETLGSGTFGTVYLCKHKVTGNVYCLKKLEQATVYQLKQMEHLKNEKQVLMMVSHPGVVKLYKTFHDVTAVYLLMEFVPGGELFLYIRKYGRLSEETAKFYVVQIILVFEYLHSRGIVYRDLKPENLLLDENGHIKLADFGFSKQIQDRTWTMCGTPDYLAPEVIKFRGHSFPVDWWALGILIYEMVAGFTPFRDDTIMGLFAKILEPHLIEYPIEFSPEVTNLVGRFLVANPAHRLGSLANGTADIKNHAWFQGIDWETAARREGRAPIVPFLTSREDTSNFKVDPANAVAPQAAPPNTQIPPDVQEFFDSF